MNHNIENNKYRTCDKINLYRDNLIKFISIQQNQIIKLSELEDIDFIVGILFLTEMNRYCKINKMSVHGYYIAYSLMNIFNKIRNKLLKPTEILFKDINHLFLSFALNIEYLNSRIDGLNETKQKINNNYCKLVIEFNPIIDNLFSYYQDHSSINIISDKIYCNDQCYLCWVNQILSKFFCILLTSAKFMGSGCIRDPNLNKLAEYYANIFYTYIKIFSINNSKPITISDVEINDKFNCDLFDNYINFKNKLNYSMLELNINSDTVDEIIQYLDNKIINKMNDQIIK